MTYLFTSWSIRTKLLAVIMLIFTLVFLWSCAVSHYLGRFVGVTEQTLTAVRLQGGVSRIEQIDSSFLSVIDVYLRLKDPSVLRYYDERMAQYEEVLHGIDALPLRESDAAFVTDLVSSRKTLFGLERAIIDRGKEGKWAEAQSLFDAPLYTASHDSFSSLVKTYNAFITAAIGDYEHDRSATEGTARRVLYGILAVIALISALAAWAASKELLRTARDVERASIAIGTGEVGQRVPVRSQDELGKIAVAFNKLAIVIDEQGAERLRQITKEIGQ